MELPEAQTAAARRSDNHIDVGQIFEDLDSDCSDTRDQLRFIRRMHVTETFGVRNALSLETRFIKIAPRADEPLRQSRASPASSIH